jgi:hypothetical protein
LTGALLDRLTHHVHILEMNGDSFRLASSRKRQRKRGAANDLIRNGNRRREIGFRYATAASPTPIKPSLKLRLFV